MPIEPVNAAPPPSREQLRQSFDEIVQTHAAGLIRFLARYTADAHAAEDLAQEAFVRAWQKLDRFDDRRPFAPWLFTLAANLGRDFLRRRNQARETAADDAEEAIDPATPPDFALLGSERRDRLEAGILGLPAGLREPLLLHYEQDWPMAAVAAHLGIEEGAVKTRLHRARRLLHCQLHHPDHQ